MSTKILGAAFLLITAWLSTQGQTSTKPCYAKIYRSTDVHPQLISTPETIFSAVKEVIDLPDSLAKISGRMLIEYVVNCNGDAVRFREIQLGEWDGTIIFNRFKFLIKPISEVLHQELKYKPAITEGKPVDFIKIFGIEFNNGEIEMDGF
jgi:hypothetical protein